MLDPPADDPILKRFRAAVATLYGHAIEWVAMLGSQPRSDAREDFDYEVAVLKASPTALSSSTASFRSSSISSMKTARLSAASREDLTSLMREIRPRKHRSLTPEAKEHSAKARQCLARANYSCRPSRRRHRPQCPSNRSIESPWTRSNTRTACGDGRFCRAGE